MTLNLGATSRVPNNTFEIFFHVVSYSWSFRFKVPQVVNMSQSAFVFKTWTNQFNRACDWLGAIKRISALV